MLALDQVLVGPHVQDEIDTTIRTTATTLGYSEALTSKCFTHQLLKLTPADAIDGFTRLGGSGYVFVELFALGPAGN
ncbi:hypothetical protein D3C80_2081700 [compost metagenome]